MARINPPGDHDHAHDGPHAHPHDDLHVHDGSHAHPHDEPGNDQGHSHESGEHDHGTGLLGWFRGNVAHSHDASDKIDNAMETHERGIWALKVSLIVLGLTALFQIIVVWISGSTALLADTIHNFGDAGTALPLWLAFALLRRGSSRRFTYGYGRAEDLAGILIVGIILFSACVAAYESIYKIIYPQPIVHLGWVAVAAIIGFVGNELVAILRIRVGKEIGSAALIADGYHSRVDGFTSLAVLLGAIGVWFGYPIADPIIGLLISITILFIVKDAATAVFRRVLDGIEPDILAQFEQTPARIKGVRDVHSVRARWLGHKVHADLHISVDPDLSVEESHRIAQQVEGALASTVRSFGGAMVHVCPAARPAA